MCTRPVYLYEKPLAASNRSNCRELIKRKYTLKIGRKFLNIPINKKEEFLHRYSSKICLYFKQFIVVISSSQNSYIRGPFKWLLPQQ